jgi:hypothetical protein
MISPLERRAEPASQPCSSRVVSLVNGTLARDGGHRLPAEPHHPKSHAYLNSSAAGQPAQRRVQGEQAVTMHPDDAAERGIRNGQYVRVFNDRGAS